MTERIFEIIAEVGREYAPDPRVALFEVGVELDDRTLVLYGVTSIPAAAEALHQRIATIEANIEVRDNLVRVPAKKNGARVHGVVRAASAPMLAGPVISETPLSQVVLGQRLLLLREHGRWMQCRSTDGYIGWIHRGYVQRMTETEARGWEMGTEAPLHFCLGGKVVAADGSVTVRLPWGARVCVDGNTAILPDGTRGELVGDAFPVASLETHFPRDGAAIVATASAWMGTPYLWGGITPSGADCSGLVQAVFRAHGVELPRDSDQQATIGQEVFPDDRFSNLRAGDLLFFSEYGTRISHVAISRGGSAVIHSALGNGGVKRNDLMGEKGYERELKKLFVCARRVL